MKHNAGFDDFRGRIDDAADDSGRIKVVANHAAGIDALQLRSFPFPALTIEIPPRKTVLRGKD
jgi:hypothetical protein